MIGTGPTAAVRKRLEATSAPKTERASFCRLIETDISFSFGRPVDHPPVMQEILQPPCQVRKTAENCAFLKCGRRGTDLPGPRFGGFRQQSVSAYAHCARFRTGDRKTLAE